MYHFGGLGRLFLRPRGPQLDAREDQLGHSSGLGSSSLVTSSQIARKAPRWPVPHLTTRGLWSQALERQEQELDCPSLRPTSFHGWCELIFVIGAVDLYYSVDFFFFYSVNPDELSLIFSP